MPPPNMASTMKTPATGMTMSLTAVLKTIAGSGSRESGRGSLMRAKEAPRSMRPEGTTSWPRRDAVRANEVRIQRQRNGIGKRGASYAINLPVSRIKYNGGFPSGPCHDGLPVLTKSALSSGTSAHGSEIHMVTTVG